MTEHISAAQNVLSSRGPVQHCEWLSKWYDLLRNRFSQRIDCRQIMVKRLAGLAVLEVVEA